MVNYTFSKIVGFAMFFVICNSCAPVPARLKLYKEKKGQLRHKEITNPPIKNVTIEYKKPHIFVKGESINISAITKCWAEEADVSEDLCVDLIDALKSKDYKYLSFFALDTVYISDSFMFPEYLGIIFSIVSPKWVVQGNVFMTFVGFSGDKVRDSPKKAPEGVDGAQGIPGRPGGTFFGVGEEFVNGEGLLIASHGGKGGTGQDGGDGRNGRDGRDAFLPSSGRDAEKKCYALKSSSEETIHGFKQELLRTDYGFFGYYAYFKIFGASGEVGSPGGNGGEGGKGGQPGTVLFLDIGTNSSGVNITGMEGDRGEEGKGGMGGNGGLNGDHVVAECNYKLSLIQVQVKESYPHWKLEYKISNGRASKGKSGKNGHDSGLISFKLSGFFSSGFKRMENEEYIRNSSELSGLVNKLIILAEQVEKVGNKVDFHPSYLSLRHKIEDYVEKNEVSGELRDNLFFMYYFLWITEYNLKYNSESSLTENIADHLSYERSDMVDQGIEPPKQSEIVLKSAIVINRFKSYVRENMRDPSKSESLSLLLKRLESHEQIRNLSEASGFLDEMRVLEEQFDELSDEVDFHPFYLSLKDRIVDYAEKNEVSGESRKVLNYLYTAVLSREYNLKYNSESSLIVNIAEHLDSLRSDMDALKESRKAINKLEIISKYKRQYEGRIEEKIKEAKDLIENLIKPDLDKIGHELEEKIDSLVAETIDLQKRAEDEKVELNKKKRELEDKLVLRALLNNFQVAGHMISFLGPAGAISGLAIGLASSVTESLALGDSSGARYFKLPEGIMSNLENLEGNIESIRDRKIERLTEVLDEWNDEAEVYPEKLGDTSVKMTEIKQKLTEGKLDFTEVRTLENEFKEELERKEKMLESEESDERNQKALITVQRFKKIVLLTEAVVDIYKKFKHGSSEIQAVENAIQQAGIKYEMLKQYEDKIYDTIVPIVRTMKRDIGFMAEEMKSTSRVSLVVADWKVQRFLRDSKKHLAKMTQGFETEEDLSNCLEELQETMSTLVNVYDHIQNFQEQQQLTNYIADINSVAGNDIGITNPEFVKGVDELEMVIQSNIVLHSYRTAMDAFKQFVFPFASLYLHDFGPLYPNDDGEMLAEAVRQIENVQSKLNLYNRSVKNPDRYIAKGDFYKKYKSSSPFYVWKNEYHRSLIGNLLSGKEVLVKADISGSPKRMDAVKFNVVALNFRTRNETLQNRLDKSLEHFEVRAVHLGNSYYRYDSKVYLLPTTSHEIEFSYEKKSDGLHPVHVGGVYEKIANGDFMLSPYASWKLTLVDITDEADFEELSLFREEVDLELVGRGHYVKNRKIKSLDIDVAKYYKAIDEDDKPLVLDVRAERRKRASV